MAKFYEPVIPKIHTEWTCPFCQCLNLEPGDESGQRVTCEDCEETVELER